MDAQVLEVEKRTPNKKGACRKLRASGRVPAVLYGHKEEPLHFSLEPRVIEKVMRDSGLGVNTLFELKGLDRSVQALIKESQQHPVNRQLLHLDFAEVREGDEVTVQVPLIFEGRPEGVVAGGTLVKVRRIMKVKAAPTKIPSEIKIDVSKMQIADIIHLGDIALPEGVACAEPAKINAVYVKAPRAAKKSEEDEGDKK
ncbi:MAG: 50S ribosomal protein L25 [Myxococcota bacterium]